MAVKAQAEKRLAFGERLAQALVFQKPGFSLKHAPLIVAATNGELIAFVKLADKLHVDVRWLATGEPSPAGAAAASRVRLAAVFLTLREVYQRELLDCLSLTPQPSIAPGECRYCGCTDEHGCGDCTWVDRAATICSACLLEKP